MGEYKNKAYTLRIDNDVMAQVRQIAELEDRTVNKQIERMAKEYIKNHYTDSNGKIVNIGRDNNGQINM